MKKKFMYIRYVCFRMMCEFMWEWRNMKIVDYKKFIYVRY